MTKIDNLFQAKASSPLNLIVHDGRTVGFKIPEYQRDYNWSEPQIARLYYDTLNGFRRVPESTKADAFTFLGSLIFVKDQKKEPDFSAESLAVVDGQQRLTTLVLFACALVEEIRKQRTEANLASLNKNVSDWLLDEADYLHRSLREFAVGSLGVEFLGSSFPFARIVREGDYRGKNFKDAEYLSPIGNFLYKFSDYLRTDDVEFELSSLGSGTAVDSLKTNFKYIRTLVRNLNDAEWYRDTECELFDMSQVRHKTCRALFQRLQTNIQKDEARDRATASIVNNNEVHNFVRTLLFSAYFCNYIVLVNVTTEDESAAFEIFDALNTTGEPLTALETFRPFVVNFEQRNKGRERSGSVELLSDISEDLARRFPNTTQRHSHTKELIVTFALYIDGQKLPRELSAQRTFLRSSYRAAQDRRGDTASKFVSALAKIAKFRQHYWDKNGIENLTNYHNISTVDKVKLLTSFLLDMKTSLSLPVLMRYWDPDIKNMGDTDFLHVLKSVVAFLVLRRAATGQTAGIDADFRNIMAADKKTTSGKFGLCTGIKQDREKLDIDELKSVFRTLLKQKLKTLDKESWVEQVVANPLYQQSKELSCFMVLAAAHQALPSQNVAGTWEISGVKLSSTEKTFLRYDIWVSKNYATVEHIAPSTPPDDGWPRDIYSDNILRHTLGNLILLPAKENSAISDHSWKKKKLFYLALTETTEEKQQKRINEAKAEGITFTPNMTNLLRSGEKLSLLEPLRDVGDWNAKIIRTRSKNIAELCWDRFWPWLN